MCVAVCCFVTQRLQSASSHCLSHSSVHNPPLKILRTILHIRLIVTLKIQAAGPCQQMLLTLQTTRHHIPQANNLTTQPSDNLKSDTFKTRCNFLCLRFSWQLRVTVSFSIAARLFAVRHFAARWLQATPNTETVFSFETLVAT